MRYIDEILQPGEKVLYSTNAHWIFYLPAIVAWLVAIVLLALSRWTTTDGIVLLCLAAGFHQSVYFNVPVVAALSVWVGGLVYVRFVGRFR